MDTSGAVQLYGPDALRHLSLTAIDLDWYCAHMTAIQLLANCSVHGLMIGEIAVLRGNSLLSDSLTPVLHASAPDRQVMPILHPVRIESIAQACAQRDSAGADKPRSSAVS